MNQSKNTEKYENNLIIFHPILKILEHNLNNENKRQKGRTKPTRYYTAFKQLRLLNAQVCSNLAFMGQMLNST